MFTGLVSLVGTVHHICGDKLFIKKESFFDDVLVGDSIAVNGVCLTVESLENGVVRFHLSDATRRTTSLGVSHLRSGSPVNLEKALAFNGKLDGHLVSGHIDTVGRVISVVRNGDNCSLEISVGSEFRKYLVPKGSVAVDGVSLTVAGLGSSSFSVAVIPVTQNGTLIGSYRAGSSVNVEFDMVGKYLYNFYINGGSYAR